MSAKDVLKFIKDKEAEFVDLRLIVKKGHIIQGKNIQMVIWDIDLL